MKRLLASLAVLALVLGVAQPAMAGTSPQGLHSSVFAHTSQDQPTDTEVGFALAQSDHQAVTVVNTARAFSHDCDGCQATAVAFQVVLASGATTLVLTNTATAVNLDCVSCTTVAIAEQWVADDVGGSIELTPAGQVELGQVHAELVALTGQPGALTGQVLALASQVSLILDQELVVVPSAGAAPLAVNAAVAPAEGVTVSHYEQVSQG
jgi:hypothetical protein